MEVTNTRLYSIKIARYLLVHLSLHPSPPELHVHDQSSRLTTVMRWKLIQFLLILIIMYMQNYDNVRTNRTFFEQKLNVLQYSL